MSEENKAKAICRMCHGDMVVILQPMDWIAPCLECSATKNLRDIESQLGGVFWKDENGEWCLDTQIPAAFT